MDFLLGLLIILTASTLLLTYLLYSNKFDGNRHTTVFILNVLLALFLAFLAYSALPDNFITKKIIAASWGVLALLSLVLKFFLKGKKQLPEILLSIATFAALVQTLIF